MLVTFNSRSKDNNTNNTPDNTNTTNDNNNTDINETKTTSKRFEQESIINNMTSSSLKPNKSTTSTNSKVTKPIHNKHNNHNPPSSTATSTIPKINPINNSTDFHLLKENSRSKLGCLTCKIRKKKCDELKPKCGDCNRLNKKCYYVDYNKMNQEEIKELKKKVEFEESYNKLRKRKVKTKPGTTTTTSNDNIKNEINKDIKGGSLKNNNNNNHKQKNNDNDKSKIYGYNSDVRSTNTSAIPNPLPNLTNSQLMNTTKSISTPPKSNTSNKDNISLKSPSPSTASPTALNSPSIQSLMNPIDEIQVANKVLLQNSNDIQLNQQHQQINAIQTSPTLSEVLIDNHTSQLNSHLPSIPSNISPLSMSDPLQEFSIKNPHSFTNNSPSPSTFLTLLRDLNESQNNSAFKFNNNKPVKIEKINDLNGTNDDDEKSNNNIKQLMNSPDFTTFLDSFEINNNIQTSNSYNDLVSNLNAHLTPMPQPSLYIPELADPQYYFLYNYYVDVISSKVSISPVTQIGSNSFQKIFLPLAHKDKGVFYSILAWASYQLGGDWASEAIKFVKIAMHHFNNSKENNRNTIINKLATLLILVGAEICNGDVKNWTVYLDWGAKLLKANGGILRFNNSREENWLITNFAYHDLLASSTSERGTYFSSGEYDKIFEDHDNFLQGQIHPLLGVSQKLYSIIGNISTLLYESKKILKEYYNRGINNHFEKSNEFLNRIDDEEESVVVDGNLELDNDEESIISDHSKASKLLLMVIEQAKKLEKEIDESKPDRRDLYNLSDQDLELQLTLFEAFQISAKLFLRESVLKCNPSHLESQILNNDLIKCLDILIGTSVQSSLVFPIFISGIHCVSKHDQEQMILRVDSFIKLYGMFNVNRVKDIIQKIWKNNLDGNKVVDWHEMLNQLGWDINFA
ncbi:hypothetical protein KGF54_000214 [Candida jiufengensis]|uniref:uncharacterized protein n=1 Tax=Candida jiufengensis TaxID=497108 RepID=UPI00222585D0|nr:uncharacterized protein KGF54_000214 [Candida jiufengensis]KAI5957286.1 hypothetical protein KGF54_000214 [Candida jiufengensis]